MRWSAAAFMAFLCACAAVQYRHDLPQTIVDVVASPAAVHTEIVRAASEWGWAISLNDRESRVVEAEDPNLQPGFFRYYIRYRFSYDAIPGGTRLNVRAIVLADDWKDYSGGGSTIPAKKSEVLVAEKIAERCR